MLPLEVVISTLLASLMACRRMSAVAHWAASLLAERAVTVRSLAIRILLLLLLRHAEVRACKWRLRRRSAKAAAALLPRE